MNVYIYDKTFDGLLTAVFDAYFRKTFPDALLSEGDALPLFCDELHTVVTDEEKAGRVWRGLQKKVSSSALGCLTQSWLSELPEIGILIFRYIRKAIDAPRSIETNFGDPEVLQLAQIWKKVDGEADSRKKKRKHKRNKSMVSSESKTIRRKNGRDK